MLLGLLLVACAGCASRPREIGASAPGSESAAEGNDDTARAPERPRVEPPAGTPTALGCTGWSGIVALWTRARIIDAPDSAIFGERVARLADLRGDGRPTVAIAAPWQGDNNGAVYLLDDAPPFGGTVEGTEALSGEAGTALGLGLGAPGDLDGDGLSDLLVWDYGDDGAGRLRVHYGPDFEEALVALGGQGLRTLTEETGGASDFDGDGYDDLWATRIEDEREDTQVEIYQGGPYRSFEAPLAVVTVPGRWKTSAVAGDVTDDQTPDLVVGALTSYGGVLVFEGPLSGSLASTDSYAELTSHYGQEADRLTFGNLDGVGPADLWVSSRGAYGNCASVWAVPLPIRPGVNDLSEGSEELLADCDPDRLQSLEAVDTNADGRDEILASFVDLWSNGMPGIASSAQSRWSPDPAFLVRDREYAMSFTVADLDGDGCQDLVAPVDGLDARLYLLPGT